MQFENTEETGSKKVLIVDDDPAIRNLISRFLQKSGYITEMAEDGKTCLRLNEEFKPDLITLDINLPDTNGYDLAIEIRATNPHSIIIIISSRTDEADKIRGFNCGANYYLTKPFSLSELEAIIDISFNFRDALKLEEEHSRASDSVLENQLQQNTIGLKKVTDINCKTILIVEDDLVNARVFSKILKKRGGYNVCHSEDTYEILRLVKSGSISIVLMDVSLARTTYQGRPIDGIELTRILRSDPKTALIPVVIVTAHAMQGDREEFLRFSGADDYISKPIVDHQGFVDFVEKKLSLEPTEIFEKLLKNFEELRAFYKQENWALSTKLQKAEEIIQNQKTRNIIPRILGKIFNRKLSDSPDFSNKSPSTDVSVNHNDDAQIREEYRIVCSDVAHGLRGEIMNIGSFNQEIRNLVNSKLPEEILEECNLIERSLKYSQLRLQRLTDYLSLSKPNLEAIEVSGLIAEIEALAKPRMPSSINMKIQIQAELEGKIVWGNSDQLKSVLIELISNATKALQNSTVISQNLSKEIQVIASHENSRIALSVKDNGLGISEELRDGLFKEVVKSEGGSGMGLYISNKVIHGMGGELKLESSEGGTTVTLLFKEAQANPSSLH